MTTNPSPVHSGFGAKTAAREAVGDRELDGVLAVVTGGCAGSPETTRALADAGATAIVPARTLDEARASLAGIARGFGSQLAQSHLGHVQLAARPWSALLRASGARVVALSSRGPRPGARSPSLLRPSRPRRAPPGSRVERPARSEKATLPAAPPSLSWRMIHESRSWSPSMLFAGTLSPQTVLESGRASEAASSARQPRSPIPILPSREESLP